MGLILKPKDRSKSGSSMESFCAHDELASLEDRLKMKLAPSAFLRSSVCMIYLLPELQHIYSDGPTCHIIC